MVSTAREGKTTYDLAIAQIQCQIIETLLIPTREVVGNLPGRKNARGPNYRVTGRGRYYHR